MNKCYTTNNNISLYLFIFYYSQLVLTLGHRQEKIVCDEKILEKVSHLLGK